MAAFLGRFGGWLYQQPYLLVALTYLMWSMNVVIGRSAAGHIPPITLAVWRWALAGLILLPFAWPHLKRDWPQIRARMPIIGILGVTGTTGYAAAAYIALQYTEAINGLLIQCTMPIVVGLTAYLMLGERLRILQMAGIVLSFVGVVVVLMRGNPDVLHSISFNRGDLWFIAATLIFAIYSPIMRKARLTLHPLSLLVSTTIAGVVLFIPLYLFEAAQAGWPVLDMKTVVIVLYVAIFPSILAYICFNRGVQLVGPNPVAALYPLIVLFGTVLALLFLDERPQLFHFVGTVLIVLGLWLATRQKKA